MIPRLHLYLLASGSAGNAAVVEGPEGSLLVDCGLSRRELHRRATAVGCDLGRVRAILVTHEHSDHVKGLPVISRHFEGPLYATAGTMAARPTLATLAYTPLATGSTLRLAGLRVRCFALSHDVEEPVGFRFDLVEQGEVLDSVGWATDTGVLLPQAADTLRGCRILGIEANHSRRMLAEGPYPYYLQRRVGGDHGHLSNDQAAKALERLVTARTETVVGMHLSQKNNQPRLAREALSAALDERIDLQLGKQDEPVVIW